MKIGHPSGQQGGEGGYAKNNDKSFFLRSRRVFVYDQFDPKLVNICSLSLKKNTKKNIKMPEAVWDFSRTKKKKATP